MENQREQKKERNIPHNHANKPNIRNNLKNKNQTEVNTQNHIKRFTILEDIT